MYSRCRITGNSKVSWNRTPQKSHLRQVHRASRLERGELSQNSVLREQLVRDAVITVDTDIPPKSIPLSVYHHDKLSATHLFTHRRVRTRKLTGLRPRPEPQAPKARQHTSLGNHHLILLEG